MLIEQGLHPHPGPPARHDLYGSQGWSHAEADCYDQSREAVVSQHMVDDVPSEEPQEVWEQMRTEWYNDKLLEQLQTIGCPAVGYPMEPWLRQAG